MYTLASLVSSGLGVALAPRSVCCYQLENIVFKSMRELPHTALLWPFARMSGGSMCGSFLIWPSASRIRTGMRPPAIAETERSRAWRSGRYRVFLPWPNA